MSADSLVGTPWAEGGARTVASIKPKVRPNECLHRAQEALVLSPSLAGWEKFICDAFSHFRELAPPLAGWAVFVWDVFLPFREIFSRPFLNVSTGILGMFRHGLVGMNLVFSHEPVISIQVACYYLFVIMCQEQTYHTRPQQVKTRGM